jgi:hypothetical protein
MSGSRAKLQAAVIALGLSLLACQPVLTVGWGEILIVSVVILLVVAPLAIRVLRVFQNKQKEQDLNEE